MKYHVLKRIVQIFLALAGVLGTFYGTAFLAMPLTLQFQWSPQSILVLQGVLAAVAGVFCWLIAVPILNKVISLTKRMEGKLQKMSTQDLLSGAVGLIIGLIVAFFIGYALSFLPTIGPYMPVVMCLVFGYLGCSVGIRKREELVAYLSNLGKENKCNY